MEYVYASENERLLIIAIENRSDRTVIFKKDYSFLDQSKLILMTGLTDVDLKVMPKIKNKDAKMIN